MIELDSKIYVAGHTGMVGSAIVNALKGRGYNNLILKTHDELELIRQKDVEDFFLEERPQYVIDAAAMVGGIKANSSYPAEFFYSNMQIEQNLIWSSYKFGVQKLLFLGSSCMYPRECQQPMREREILTGLPEETNEGYALAKICGQRLCSYLAKQYGARFITAIPANAYGIGDSFEIEKCHVIPALIMKCHNAKVQSAEYISLWGTGKAVREFINTKDIASACIFLLENYEEIDPVNVGSDEEISIFELTKLIKEIVGYEGSIRIDATKPDGMPRRLCDNSRIFRMGWKPEIDLKKGITELYKWYVSNIL